MKVSGSSVLLAGLAISSSSTTLAAPAPSDSNSNLFELAADTSSKSHQPRNLLQDIGGLIESLPVVGPLLEPVVDALGISPIHTNKPKTLASATTLHTSGDADKLAKAKAAASRVSVILASKFGSATEQVPLPTDEASALPTPTSNQTSSATPTTSGSPADDDEMDNYDAYDSKTQHFIMAAVSSQLPMNTSIPTQLPLNTSNMTSTPVPAVPTGTQRPNGIEIVPIYVPPANASAPEPRSLFEDSQGVKVVDQGALPQYSSSPIMATFNPPNSPAGAQVNMPGFSVATPLPGYSMPFSPMSNFPAGTVLQPIYGPDDVPAQLMPGFQQVSSGSFSQIEDSTNPFANIPAGVPILIPIGSTQNMKATTGGMRLPLPRLKAVHNSTESQNVTSTTSSASAPSSMSTTSDTGNATAVISSTSQAPLSTPFEIKVAEPKSTNDSIPMSSSTYSDTATKSTTSMTATSSLVSQTASTTSTTSSSETSTV